MNALIKPFLILISLALFAGCGGSKNDDKPPAIDYGAIGKYKNDVQLYTNNNDKYIVYSPKDHLADAPIVLFIPGGHIEISEYSGLMKYIASHGYFVIGTQINSEYSDHSTNLSFEKALTVARAHHPELDFSKLAIIGHSQGGGLAFPVMKHFLDAGVYGTAANQIISLDGWFAFGMDQQDIRSLVTNASFIQFGGSSGTGTDPRIHLTILNLMPNTNEKSFLTLDQNRGHSYATGTLNELLARKDLLKPIHAILAHQFNHADGASSIVFDSYESTVDSVKNSLKDQNRYSGDCDGDNYNAKPVLLSKDINYCTPEQY